MTTGAEILPTCPLLVAGGPRNGLQSKPANCLIRLATMHKQSTYALAKPLCLVEFPYKGLLALAMQSIERKTECGYIGH